MNIAMFTNAYRPIIGGVEKSIETFCEDLNKREQRTLVVTLDVANAEHSEKGIFRMPALKEVSGTEFSIKLPVPANLKKQMDDFNPDIIHSHHPFMLGDTALRVAKARNLPVVFTHHTLYERYTYLFARDSQTLPRIAKALATEYANLCDMVVAPTESIKNLARKRGVNVPIEIIPTGIDIQMYKKGNREAFRKKHNIPLNVFVPGYVGRVVEAKNMDFLAKAVIPFLHENKEARYLIVGDGECVEPLKKTFSGAGVIDRVIMTGSLTGSDVADAYAAIDIFPFASKTETQGIVLIEAFSAGVPVIALDAPGSRDIIQDNKNGRLLESNTSAQDFASELAAAASNRDLRRKWSKSAQRRAETFSRNRCADQLLESYKKLTKQNRHKKQEDSLQIWDSLQKRFSTEWDLFKAKLAVLSAGITDS